jgi:hypothetical protein
MSEIIKVPISVYRRALSSFSYEGAAYWWSCRDGFQSQSAGKDVIFYHHTPEIIGNTAKFLQKVEELIGLGETRRVKFVKCNDSKVLCMKLSRFWRNPARRSLLTLLLRAGRNYDEKKDDWKECIEKSLYCRSKRTKESVFRFIEGHTKLPKITGYFGGWCNYFNGYNRVNKPVKDILT